MRNSRIINKKDLDSIREYLCSSNVELVIPLRKKIFKNRLQVADFGAQKNVVCTVINPTTDSKVCVILL